MISLDNGRILLYNDDSRYITIPPGDVIIADTPYYGVVKDKWDNAWNTLEEYLIWYKEWLENIQLTDSGSLYVFGGIGEKNANILYIKQLIDKYYHFKDIITWKKDRGMGNRRGWVYTREELLWYVKNNKNFIWNKEHQYSTETRKRDKPDGEIRVSQNGYKIKSPFKRITNVWTDISEQQSMGIKKHTTPKPKKLIERIINVHTTDLEQLVIDPFLGSGTTGEVCASKGQRFIGIEKDKDNFEEALYFINKALEERHVK